MCLLGDQAQFWASSKEDFATAEPELLPRELQGSHTRAHSGLVGAADGMLAVARGAAGSLAAGPRARLVGAIRVSAYLKLRRTAPVGLEG